MQDCTAPEDLFTVLTTVWPPLPLVAIVLLIATVILWIIEGSMRFGFGGVPDGLFGMLGLALLGIAIITWGYNWPSGCSGTVHVLGWVAIGIAILVGGILFVFWRARRADGGMLIRGYDNQQPPHPAGYDHI